MRQIVSSRTGVPRSRSARPNDREYATSPWRATSAWQPATFPGSTYRVTRCSPMRSRRASSNPWVLVMVCTGECYASPGEPGPTDLHRRLGAQARHLAALLLRSSLTYRRVGSLRSSAQTHDLTHLDTNSLGANRWIRARGGG